MLKPGDICPCCGARIPENITPDELARLSAIQISNEYDSGLISAAGARREQDELTHQFTQGLAFQPTRLWQEVQDKGFWDGLSGGKYGE